MILGNKSSINRRRRAKANPPEFGLHSDCACHLPASDRESGRGAAGRQGARYGQGIFPDFRGDGACGGNSDGRTRGGSGKAQAAAAQGAQGPDLFAGRDRPGPSEARLPDRIDEAPRHDLFDHRRRPEQEPGADDRRRAQRRNHRPRSAPGRAQSVRCHRGAGQVGQGHAAMSTTGTRSGSSSPTPTRRAGPTIR